jgi:hypothetical protein
MTDSVFQLTVDQKVPVSLEFVDAHGNSAPTPAGVPTWAVDKTDLLAVSPSVDGLTADLVTVGAQGVAIVTVSLVVDATTTILGTLSVTIVGGAVASITIVPGTPVSRV